MSNKNLNKYLNDELFHAAVNSILFQTLEIFYVEDLILKMLTKKHHLRLSEQEQRSDITNQLNLMINSILHPNEDYYKYLLSDLKEELETYKELNDFIAPEGLPLYINFLISVGFPFDVEYLDKENFYQLIEELKQTPEFIECETKRKNFINKAISPMKNFLKRYDINEFNERYSERIDMFGEEKKIRTKFL